MTELLSTNEVAAPKARHQRTKALPVEPKSALWNPSPEEIRKYAEAMPNARITEWGNVNVATRVVSRSKLSTHIATTRAEYARVAKLQDDYIRTRDMVVVEGFIGNDPDFRVPARLIMETANANVAAMQSILYYPATPAELEHFEPKLTVIYTPNLPMPGYQDDRLIAVDLENYVTRVFNSDYFGESKKGGLRMWNKLVYERGGLALPPGGKVSAAETGCFPKPGGLNPNDEPTIYYACASPHAYLENVSQSDDGKVDYFDTSYTPNGRAVIRMQDIAGAADAREVKKVDFLLILNRNENITPAVA